MLLDEMHKRFIEFGRFYLPVKFGGFMQELFTERNMKTV